MLCPEAGAVGLSGWLNSSNQAVCPQRGHSDVWGPCSRAQRTGPSQRWEPPRDSTTTGPRPPCLGIDIVHEEEAVAWPGVRAGVPRVPRPEPGQVNVTFTETRQGLGRRRGSCEFRKVPHSRVPRRQTLKGPHRGRAAARRTVFGGWTSQKRGCGGH